MSKTIIEVKCTDQVLTLTNTPVIASGGVGEDFVSAEFCEKWDDYAPSLLFWRKGVDPIPVLEDDDGLFPVPAELTGVDGIVYFGAVGYDTDGNRRTSQAISYRLEAGAITEGTELPAPSGDVFDQIMAYYADVKLYVATRIDEAAKAAEDSYSSASAAWLAVDEAERKAGDAAGYAADAVNAVDGVIYPGVVQAALNNGSNSISVTLDRCPPDKLFLTFQAPGLSGYDSFYLASLSVLYPADDGTTTRENFWLRDGYQSKAPDNAIQPLDTVTVLLSRVDGKAVAYIVNPRITQTALDEMARQIYPGLPTSKTTNGTMVISLGYEPEDRFFLVFVADAASSTVNKFVLDYESYEEGPVQIEYALWDAERSPVESYGFYQGDHVVVMLSPADERATVLNPRVTRDTMNLIQGVVDMIPNPDDFPPACEVVSYVGNGASSVSLNFSQPPKLIHIESLGTGGYTVSATLFCEAMKSKVRVFSDGEHSEYVTDYFGSWGKTVQVRFSDSYIPVGQLNANGTKYVAIGIM